MKSVLLLTNPYNADTIGTKPTTREDIKRHVIAENGINIGNKVFITSIEQYLTDDNIKYDCKPYQSTNPEVVTEEYDYVVAPLANIFGFDSKDFLADITRWIKKLRIPFFVVSCGIQCDYDEQIKDLRTIIGAEVTDFIEAVYDSGGAIATRGFLTKEFLDMCVLNDAVPTGCPSLYRGGPLLSIKKQGVSKEEFKVAFTSMDYPKKWIRQQMSRYANSVLFDQGIVFGELFKHDSDMKLFVKAFIKHYGIQYLNWLIEGRIYTPADIWCWTDKIRNYNLAYGSRIHGSMIAVQAGIPVEVVCIDSRVREIASFIGLPIKNGYASNMDLYEEYEKIDFTNFSHRYKEGYAVFENFWISKGIVSRVGTQEKMNKIISESKFEDIVLFSDSNINEINEAISNSKYKLYDTIMKYGNKFKRGDY